VLPDRSMTEPFFGSGGGKGGGGGGGFRAGDNGANGTASAGGAGGGSAGLGGSGANGGLGGDGGSGAEPVAASYSGNGGFFGTGGGDSSSGGGGGIGGGGGGITYGGGGGFGGGGGGGTTLGGGGGFGGGGGGGGGAFKDGYGGFGGGNGGSGTANGGGGAGLGGAIFNLFGSVSITNSTIANNTATGGTGASSGQGLGAGLFTLDGSVSLLQDSFAFNSASSEAGDIYNLAYGNLSFINGAFAASVTTYNTILASGSGSIHGLVNQQFTSGFTAGGLPQNGSNSATLTGSNNLIPNGVSILSGTNSLANPLTGNPNFGSTSPQSNGGPMPTLALTAGSAAQDAGDNSAPGLSALTSDERGFPFVRISGGTVDIGAYEVQPLNVVVDTAVDENDGNYGTGNLSLREAILLTNGNANTGNNTITFAAGLAGQTITLTSSLPHLNYNETITGLGANQLTIDGNSNSYQLFAISSGLTANISGLTLAHGGGTTAGGAISVGSGATVVVTSCTFSNDTAGRGGAIDNLGTLTVSGSTFANNTATNIGAAIDNGDILIVTNCTFTGNSADRGGAIGNGTSTTDTLTGQSCTISQNSATTSGGGIDNNAGGNVTLQNTIVAGDTAPTGPDINGTATANYCLIKDTTNWTMGAGSGNNVTGQDPALGGLAYNGGPTQTMAITSGSPAYNAGSNALLTLPPPTVLGAAPGGGGSLPSNTTYVYLVTAVNLQGETTGSFAGTFLPLGGSSVTIVWASVTGASGYKIYGRNGTPQFMAFVPATNTGTASFTDTGAITPSGSTAPTSNTTNPTSDQRGPGFPRIVSGTVDIGAYEVPLFSDNFNGTGSLSGSWQIPPLPQKFLYTHRRRLGFGGFTENNKAISVGTGFDAEQVAGMSPLNPTLTADVDASNAQALVAGLMARLQPNGDCYAGILTNSGQAEIVLFYAATNSFTVLKSANAGGNTGTMTFSVINNTLSLVCGTANISINDFTLASAGGAGIFAWGPNGTIDNFSLSGS
jgi:hypothetical protein